MQDDMAESFENGFRGIPVEEFTVGTFLDIYERESPPFDMSAMLDALGDDGHLLFEFGSQDIQTQARLIHQLEQTGLDVEAVLRQTSIITHRTSQTDRLDIAMDSARIDTAAYQLQRGHIIEALVETHPDGVSRDQAALLNSILPQVASGGIIGIERTDEPLADGSTDDRLLDLINQTIETLGGTVCVGSPQEETAIVRAAIAAVGGRKVSGVRVLGPLETELTIIAGMPSGYGYEFVKGVVKEVPNGNNWGVLTLAGGREIDQNDVRVLSIVGADVEELLNRSEDEVYYGQRVRVWAGHDFGWVTGTVVDASMPRNNMVGVRTDARIGDSDWLDGHGFNVNFGGPSLDTQDLSKPPRKHPLEDYPGYEEGRCVTVAKDGRPVHGFISRLSPDQKLLRIETEDGSTHAHFDDEVTVWPRPSGESGNTVVGVGDVLARYNLASGRHEAFHVRGVCDGVVIGQLKSHRQPSAPHAYEFTPDDVASMQRAPLGSCPKFYETFGGEDNDVLYGKVEVTFPDPEGSGRMLTGQVLTDGGYPFFLDVIILKPDERRVRGDDPYDRYTVHFSSIRSVIRKDADD